MSDAPTPSDAALIADARGGNVDAFGLLVERHQGYVYNAVYHLVRSDQDAEDISQEVFVKAYRNLARFREEARFTTWVYGIMLNTVRSFWRKSGRRKTLPLENPGEDGRAMDGPPDTGEGPDAQTERREQIETVRAAVGELDRELREIIVMRDIQGLSYEDLADALDLPAGTVKSRLHRARHALKLKLEPLYGQAGSL